MTIDLKKIFGDLSSLDSKMTNALLKAMKENFVEEFDYLRFKQSVQNMNEMGLDQETSIKSAFATASTMGLTKDKLIKTANHYKTVLNKERDEFTKALQGQMKSKIDDKRAEAATLQKTIEDYQKKIAKMKAEMEIYQKKINGVEGQVEKAKAKIEDTRVKFANVYTSLSEKIDDDISKLDAIL